MLELKKRPDYLPTRKKHKKHELIRFFTYSQKTWMVVRSCLNYCFEDLSKYTFNKV